MVEIVACGTQEGNRWRHQDSAVWVANWNAVGGEDRISFVGGADKRAGRNRARLVHSRRQPDDSLAWVHQKDEKDTAAGSRYLRISTQAVSGRRWNMRNRHIGSDFDEFLQEEGILAETEATAVKRVIAHQIEQEMKDRQISKSALAQMMNTSRSSLDRLLDPENASVTLLTLESVAQALGKRLIVRLG